MKIVVGSNNAVKSQAVMAAFSQAYSNQVIDIEGVSTDSGVSAHPTNANEALQGALNRVNEARKQRPNADYYIGIEGGLLQDNGRAWEIGWVAIMDSAGRLATGLSAGIEIRGEILAAILDGVELNDVLENFYGIVNAGRANGFYGIATDDLVTRQQAYEQGIHFALAQYKHPELYKT